MNPNLIPPFILFYDEYVQPSSVRQNSCNLFINGAYENAGILDLFLSCSPTGTVDADLNLYLYGAYNSVAGSLPLYVGSSGQTNSLNLYTKAPGTNSGYVPNSGSLNLYIHRDTVNTLNLFLKAPEGSPNNWMYLSIPGATASNGSLNLIVPNIEGEVSKILTMFVSGD